MNSIQQLVRFEGNAWAENGIIANSVCQEDTNEEVPIEKEEARMDASDSNNEGRQMGLQNVENPSPTLIQKPHFLSPSSPTLKVIGVAI